MHNVWSACIKKAALQLYDKETLYIGNLIPNPLIIN